MSKFPSTVVKSNDSPCWTTPILRLISFPSWAGSIPRMLNLPDVGLIRVVSALMSVVFPAPFFPRRPNTSPFLTLRLKSFSAKYLPS